MKKLQKFVALTLAFQLSLGGVIAQVHGAMISADAVLQTQQGDTSLHQIERWLSRAEVRRQLTDLGVAPEQASERVRSLTDAELNEMAARLDQLPAGAGVIEVLGIVFIVLLVLEFVGVIDIFKRR